MKTSERFTPDAILFMKTKIREYGGREVNFCGYLNEKGLVAEIKVVASGTEGMTAAPKPHLREADVIIHNHPSGCLHPSKADVNVSSSLGHDGVGSYIIDNNAENVTVVVEPYIDKEKVAVDSSLLIDFCESKEGFAKFMGDYEYRESQSEMMKAVTDALNNNRLLVAEAGTGIGKSLAYLIPSVKWVSENKSRGARIVISTATINLQDQLIKKDLPLAMKILNADVKYVLMKGRNNYLCRRRFDEELALGNSLFEDEIDWTDIRDWSLQTETGDFSELNFPFDAALKSRICSESDNCLGIQCPFYDKCFVFNLRREAAGARIIVVNNHLLFADIALRLESSGDSEEGSILIPGYTKVIFDEAHNIEKDATRYFTSMLSAPSVRRVMNRIKTKRGTRVFGLLSQLKKFHGVSADRLGRIDELQNEIVSQLTYLDEQLLSQTDFSVPQTRSLPVNGSVPLPDFARTSLTAFHCSCEKIINELTDVIDLLEGNGSGGDVDSVIRETSLCVRRIAALTETVTKFLAYESDSDNVYWLSKEKRMNGDSFVQFNITPMDVGPILADALWSETETAVCTSATLAVDSRFEFFLKSIGMDGFGRERLETLMFTSPFDYRNRVLLAVASDEAPDVSASDFLSYAAAFTRDYLLAVKGRALLLFTSLSQMNAVYEAVAGDLEAAGITAFRQGGESRRLLLDRFKEDIGSVLFATDSFWEGIDAPGKTLEHLLIFRLPFRVPDDPVLAARSQRVDRNGGRSFFELSVPQAVMRFKQGFGRVMRKKTDCGVVVVLDKRIVTKPAYGSLFFKSIPQTSRVIGCPDKIIDTASRFMEYVESQ